MKTLKDSVTQLSNVGVKRQHALNELGIFTIEDLLLHFPFRYEDMQLRDITEWIDQDKVRVKGTVVTPPVASYFGMKKNRLSFKIAIDYHVITVIFFNQHYLKSKIELGQELQLFGKWDEKKQQLLGMKLIGVQQTNDFESVYHVNKGIKQTTLLTLIKEAYLHYGHLLQELLPQSLIEKYQHISYQQAVHDMHFPKSNTHFEQARSRLLYQELFVYQLQLHVLKLQRYAKKSVPLQYDVTALKQFIQHIPFELTNAQKRVTNAICKDLLAPFTMNRLLQGDVGSGKTVVASIVSFATMLANCQVACMVPTEILAMQHFETFRTFFEHFNIKLALLTSSTSAKERRLILEQLKNGTIQFVVGTHALIQEDVHFKQLGLVIIDEQHRFGVHQRQLLKEKCTYANVLYMSATPIPRTLTLSVYGEMDVSVIDELPVGRKEIKTTWVKEKAVEQVFDFVKKQLKLGRQAYVITSLIEESTEVDLKNACDMQKTIQQLLGATVVVDLLHGRMKQSEKDAIMAKFIANKSHVLVSTTVIEVGVNIPNASVMVIQDAERFGLSQLHQLRGRVGRGQYQSYCILIGNPKTEHGKMRLKIMSESNDGFYLSQKDLQMRGSGDVFGVKQSGLPTFKIADIVRDEQLLLTVLKDMKEVFPTNDWLMDEQFLLLKNVIFDKITTVH